MSKPPREVLEKMRQVTNEQLRKTGEPIVACMEALHGHGKLDFNKIKNIKEKAEKEKVEKEKEKTGKK